MSTVEGTVAVKWVESKLMTGVDSSGHSLVIGRWPEQSPQWAGQKPSDLLLLAAASCSTYDVIMILEKQRDLPDSLEVYCTGEQETEPPYQFTSIHLHYKVRGSVSPKKLERAIQLSEEKYCSVINTLKPAVTITSDYELTE
jgi:putative redox protein